MEYNGYFIYPDKTGLASKDSKYSFFLDDGEMYCGSGETIEDCKNQIDDRNLFEIHEHAHYLECEFLNWIKIKGWLYIKPLDIYQHKNKEIYKTKSELNDIFLTQRNS